MTDTSTTSTGELILTPDKDLPKVLAPVLDHLQATVVRGFPAEHDVANQIRVANEQIAAQTELASRGTDRVRRALDAYQATMEPLGQAHRQHRVAVSDQGDGKRTFTPAELAERRDAYVAALGAARQQEARLVGEVRGHLRLVDRAGQHDLAYGYLKQLADTRLDFLSGQRSPAVPIDEDRPERPEAHEDRMTQVAEYQKRAAATLAQFEADYAEAIDGDQAHRDRLVAKLKQTQGLTLAARKKLAGSIGDLRRLMAKGADHRDKVVAATQARQRAVDALAKAGKGDKTDSLETDLARHQKMLDTVVAAEEKYQRDVIRGVEAVRLRIPPDDARRRIVDALKTSVQAAVLEQNHDRVKTELRQAAKAVSRSGSSITTELSGTLGASIGFLEEYGASISATANIGLAWKIANTNNKFTATFEHSEKLGTKVSAGGKVGSAKLTGVLKGQGGGVFATTRTYDSLDDLVANEGMLVYLTSPVSYGKLLKRDMSGAKNINLVRQRDKLLRFDNANRVDLEGRLRNLGAISATQGLRPNTSPGVDVVTTKSRAATVEVGGAVVAQIADHAKLGASGSIGATKTREQDHKIVSFLDDVEDNPALQAIHAAKRPDYFGWFEAETDKGRLQGQGATERLAQLEDDIEKTRQTRDRAKALVERLAAEPSTAANRDKLAKARDLQRITEAKLQARANELRKNLDYLQIEYSGFVNLANHIERGIIPETDATRRMRKGYLQERGIGSGGTAEYVKAVALNYAYLRRLYERSHPEGNPPAQELKHLNDFGAEIRVPPLTINDDEFRKAFELKADSPIRRLTTYSGSVTLAVGGTGSITEGEEKLQGVSQSGNLTVGFSFAQSKVRGDLEPDDTFTLSVDVGGGALGDNFVGNLFGTETIKNLLRSAPVGKKGAKDPDKDNQDKLQAELADVMKDLAVRGNTVDVTLVRKNLSWRLQSAVSSETSQRKLGVKGTIPTGTVVGVVGAASAARSRKVVKRQYFGSNTLSTLTDLYRDRHRVGDDPDDDRHWDAFCVSSGLLDRIVAQVDQTARTNPTGPGSFSELVAQIKAEEAQGGTRGTRRQVKLKGPKGPAAGVLNDLGEWLIALATSDDDADRKAAKAFIAAYEQPGRTKAQQADRATALAGALKTVTSRKAGQEDRDDGFRRKRRIGAEDVDRYVAGRIMTEGRRLQADLAKVMGRPVGFRSLADLAETAASHFQATGDDRSFALLKRAYGLDHVATNFTNLRQVGNKADRETAIATLGSDLDHMFAEPKLYISTQVEGELVKNNRGVVVQPVVKKGQSAAVTTESIDKATRRGLQRIEKSGLAVAKARNVQMVSDYPGSRRLTWRADMADAKARSAEAKKHAHKVAKRGRGQPKSIGRQIEKTLAATGGGKRK